MDPHEIPDEDAKIFERKRLLAEFFKVAMIIHPAEGAAPVDAFTAERAKRRYWELIRALSDMPLAD